MKRSAAAVALGVIVVAGVAAGSALWREDGSGRATKEARTHLERAERHIQRGELGAYGREWVAAVRADSTWVEPLLLGMAGLRSEYVYTWLLQQRGVAARRIPDPALRDCAETLQLQAQGYCPARTNVTRIRDATDVCHLVVDAFSRRSEDNERLRRLFVDALQLYPNSTALQWLQLQHLLVMHADEDVLALARIRLRPGNAPMVRARAYVSYALAAHRVGRHAEALDAERRGLAFSRAAGAGVLWEYASTLNTYTAETSITSDTSGFEWQDHARRMLQVADSLKAEAVARSDAYMKMAWLRATGVTRLDHGDLVGAVARLTEAMAQAAALHDTSMVAEAMMRRGRALVKQGRLAEAERDLLRARRLASREARFTALEVEHNLFHLYEGKGDDAAAEATARRFIEHTEATRCPVQLVAYRDVALFYMRRGRLREADTRFRQMVSATEQQEHEFLWAGEYYELIGNLDRAEHYYEREWREGGSSLRALPGLIRLAELRGDTAMAQRWARLHDEWLIAQRNPEAIPLLPGVLAAHGQLDAATAVYEQARAGAAARGQLASWAALTSDEAANELRAGHPLDAEHLAERAAAAARRLDLQELGTHAAALRELALVSMRPRSPAGGAAFLRLRAARARAERMQLPTLITELRRMEGDAAALRRDVPAALAAFAAADLAADSVALSLASEPSRASYRASQIGISNRALSLILAANGDSGPARFAAWSARRKARTLRDASPTHAVSLPALRRALATDEAIIDYTMLDTAVAALVITREETVLQRLPTTARELATAARALRTALEPRLGTQLDLGRARLDLANAHWLHSVLLRPLASALEGRRRLYIVPDGELHMLPFDVLAEEVQPSPVFLLDTHEIVLMPSLAGTLRRQPRPDVDRVLITGATATRTAPGSDEEIRAIVRALSPSAPMVLRRRAATETRLRRALPQAAVVHFALHAEPNEVEPLHAVLHLEPEAGSDGRLMAAEIARMDFTGRHVVLSGCETAGGRLLAGEGVLNLSRAFLGAGAASTLATLWPVGAATAPLMGAYYRALARGQGAAAALRSAKLELRAQPSFSHPLFWAPYVIISSSLDAGL